MANAAARVHNTSEVETNDGVDELRMKAHEKYFENLLPPQLTRNQCLSNWLQTKLSSPPSRMNWLQLFKQKSNMINNLERETSCLKKTGGQGNRDPTLCSHCKKGEYHAAEAYFELAKN